MLTCNHFNNDLGGDVVGEGEVDGLSMR